jgi:AcrR family transcriptional regulator
VSVHWLVATETCSERPMDARATFTIVVSSAGASAPMTITQISFRVAGSMAELAGAVTAVGYAKFTMEGAAARAGAARSVLYRRWPNRAALVHAAMRHHMGSLDDRVPDTGDLRADILLALRDIRDKFLEVGPEVVHGLMSEATDLPPELMEVTPRAVTAVLTRAADRGQVSRDKITRRITSLPGDLLRHEMMRPRGDTSDAFLAEIVDEVFLPLVSPAY